MINIEIAAKEFLLACRADGLKPATIRWYRHMLNPFIARFYGNQVDRLETQAVRQYVIDLRSRGFRFVNAPQRPELEGGLSHESLRDHLAALRRFFNWCVMEYDLAPATNPMRRIKLPTRQRQEPKAIAVEDLRRLLEATDDSQIGIRDRAMICFLTDTGCRAAGMLTLKLDDLHIKDRYAVVREKGDRSRAVPFTEFTCEALRTWLTVRPLESETAFCALGTTNTGKALTLSGLHSLLKRLKKKAGVTGRVNPHSFRHGFARQYLINGGDLATLAQLMGHSNVSVTATFYAVFKDQELAKMHDKFSPIRSLSDDPKKTK